LTGDVRSSRKDLERRPDEPVGGADPRDDVTASTRDVLDDVSAASGVASGEPGTVRLASAGERARCDEHESTCVLHRDRSQTGKITEDAPAQRIAQVNTRLTSHAIAARKLRRSRTLSSVSPDERRRLAPRRAGGARRQRRRRMPCTAGRSAHEPTKAELHRPRRRRSEHEEPPHILA
jgi:hypothetical protein